MLRDRKLECAFCGKLHSEVKVLIEGPKVYICNECVELCRDVIEARDKTREEELLTLSDESSSDVIANQCPELTEEAKKEADKNAVSGRAQAFGAAVGLILSHIEELKLGVERLRKEFLEQK